MNFKTSVVLSVVFLVLLAGFFVLRASEKSRTSPDRPSSPTARLEQLLFEEPPKELVRVTCTKAGQPPWRFERINADDEDAPAEWRLAEPISANVPTYLVDGIVNRIKNLKYQVKYASGDPDTITATQAGLDPPKVEVELTQRDGTILTTHIGKAVSNNETFVRLAGADDIYVVKASLDTLLKKRVEEYRDKVMLKFDAADATSIEITHRPGPDPSRDPEGDQGPSLKGAENGQPVHYRLVKRDRDGWVFEEPFNADADDKAVDAAVKAMARLRAGEWVDSGTSPHLGRYGLSEPRVEIEVICEEKTTVPVETGETQEKSETESEEEESSEPQTIEKIETRHYRVLIAGRSPLGKDTSVYAKLGDDPAIATISKTSARALTPAVEKWRNMKICRSKVSEATRIEIRSRDGGAAIFVKDENENWVSEDRGSPAEGSALQELIDKIDSLRAIAFVDNVDPTDPAFGLIVPHTEIVLTVPGSETPEHIAVGDPTDQAGKRLFYVRYGNSTSIAKVRAADVAPLQRSTLEYENREIIKLAVGSLESIVLTRPNSVTGQPEALTLEKQENGSWGLTFPVNAKTDPLTTTALLTTLANLRAESVVARSGPDSDYGLDNSSVGMAITYEGPTVIKASTAVDVEAGTETGDQETETSSGPPPPTLEMFMLSIAERDSLIYAKRSNRPTIYGLSRNDYESFLADYHVKDVWDIQESEVVSVAVTSGGVTHRFDNTDDGWIYASEPDLPIDANKVANLILQIQDLKLERFVAYGVSDLDPYELEKPAKKVTLRARDGKKVTLLVSGNPCLGNRSGNLCAVIEGSADVFLLTPDTVSRFDINMEEFETAG